MFDLWFKKLQKEDHQGQQRTRESFLELALTSQSLWSQIWFFFEFSKPKNSKIDPEWKFPIHLSISGVQKLNNSVIMSPRTDITQWATRLVEQIRKRHQNRTFENLVSFANWTVISLTDAVSSSVHQKKDEGTRSKKIVIIIPCDSYWSRNLTSLSRYTVRVDTSSRCPYWLKRPFDFGVFAKQMEKEIKHVYLFEGSDSFHRHFKFERSAWLAVEIWALDMGLL